MSTNELKQWICVAVIFGIIAVGIVRYFRRLFLWSKSVSRPGCHTTGEPPCCGGKPDKKPKCGCEDHGKKPAPGSSPCAACTGNCPLSRSDHHEN